MNEDGNIDDQIRAAGPSRVSKGSSWWEVLIAPFGSIVFLILLPFIALASIPIELRRQRRQGEKEKELKGRLCAAGRSISWSEVDAKLRCGEGTLIVEHCSPKGPVREWWTSEDVIGEAATPIPPALLTPMDEAAFSALKAFAESCVKRHIDREHGTALITEVPIPPAKLNDRKKYVWVHLGGGVMSGIFLPTERNLAALYPSGKIVTLIMWPDSPFIFKGDAEAVFLSEANRPQMAKQGS